ncbi:uncharacterized protein LOC112089822 [Eutrema salsugineum]|uniref:uncharacterized protein LOC112089822 n=1 Tax=Eutrema salsugineum TaxID=72664 RepID=UPI000CECF83A|nr:uncharacterized protein LOC112089822 [Eutrema salsugineum]
MENPEFPPRLFSKGDEPSPLKSIGYYSGETKLMTALEEALTQDEWEEILNSRLGVFLKFSQLDFGWASRLVHYILGMQLVCKKKFEIWSLVGLIPIRFSLNEFEHITGLNCEYVDNLEDPVVEITDEMKDFWERLGVNQELGPSTEDLIEACKECGSWSSEDRLRLGYLSIYTSYIEARKPSSATQARLARLVMDLEAFENYLWGRVAFKNLMRSVKEKEIWKSSYTIEGFVQVQQVWVYFALPDFAAKFGEPLPGDHNVLLIAFKGSRGRKFMKENMLRQTRINNYVVKEFFDMFPRWEIEDDDEEDERTDNIIKAMYGHFGPKQWTWERSHWPPTGVTKYVKSEGSVDLKRRSESVGDQGSLCPASGEEDESMVTILKDHMDDCFNKMMDGLSSCESQIKLLNTKLGTVEQKLEAVILQAGTGGTKEDVTQTGEADAEGAKPVGDDQTDADADPNIGSNFMSKQNEQTDVPSESVNDGKQGTPEPSVVMVDPAKCDIDFDQVQKDKHEKGKKAAQLVVRAKSERLRKLAPTQQSPFKPNSTAKEIIPNKNVRGCGYDPFDMKHVKQKIGVLTDCLKKDPAYPKRVKWSSVDWYFILRVPKQWLADTHMEAGINLLRLRFTKHPEWFRSDRITFLDSYFATMWRYKYKEFVDSHANPDGSGKLLPAGSFEYYTGAAPTYCISNKTWGYDVDDLYSMLHITDDHWVAMWISIPMKHIVISDSHANTHASDIQIEASVTPITVLVPYILRECAPAEDRINLTYDPFTWERIKGHLIPQNKQSGDCGVYCLKYLECHALGMPFPKTLCDANIKNIRDKLAAEIFDETGVTGTEKYEYPWLDVYEGK